MAKPKPIPQRTIDICEEFIRNSCHPAFAEQFTSFMKNEQYTGAIIMLESMLDTRSPQGFPRGRKGTPTQRYVAESLLKELRGQGHGCGI